MHLKKKRLLVISGILILLVGLGTWVICNAPTSLSSRDNTPPSAAIKEVQKNSNDTFPVTLSEPLLPAKTDTKYYVGATSKCQRIKYRCEQSWEAFNDDLGCGCLKIKVLSDSILGKTYLGDVDTCAVMGLWTCPDGERVFSDDTGCGCETL